MSGTPTQQSLSDQVADLERRVAELEQKHDVVTAVGTVVTDPAGVLRYPGDVEFRVTADRKISRTPAGGTVALVDPVTANVEAICNQNNTTISQRNKAGNYYRRPISGPDGVWTQIAATAASAGPLYVAPPAPAPGSVYRANAGRIIAPDGQEWRGKGLNAGTMGVNNLGENLDIFKWMANALVETVPGTNLLRAQVWQVAIDSGLTPEMLSPMVNVLTSKGVVVEIEYHDYPTTITGGRLNQVAQWYNRAATVFKPNPMVIFGAQNEPGDQGGVDTMNNELYNAVRSASDTLFFWTMTGGWSLQGMDANRYAGMHNVGADWHFYAWEVNGTQSGCTVAEAYAKIQQIVGQIKRFVGADGPPPVLVGEYGVHGLGGTGFDPGGQQSVGATQRALDDGVIQACCNWAWRTFNTHGPGMPYIAGDLVIPPWTGGGGSLTQNPAGGQEHANWVAGRGIGFT